jgi:hypothetical protein
MQQSQAWARAVHFFSNPARLFVSDKCLGFLESVEDFYPEAKWQWT